MVAVHRTTVGLFWCHPLVLPQFEQLISESGHRLLARRLESNRIPDFENLAVPRAGIHIVESHSHIAVTEAVVTGIHARQSSARILVLAERFNDPSAFALLRLGVKGLLTYSEGVRALPQALATVEGGGLWVGRALLSRFVDAALCTVPLKVYASGVEGLTRRERQVLEAVLDNLSNKEIARRLKMSERTAKFHVSNLLVKHGVRRRADLLFRALQGSSTAPGAREGSSRQTSTTAA